MSKPWRRYWPAIPIAAVFVGAVFLEWSHAQGPRQQTYAAAPQTPAAAPSQAPGAGGRDAETYNCRIEQFANGESRSQGAFDPFVVKDGTIILPYHGDLAPTPAFAFAIVKDDADQLVAMKYIPDPIKDRDRTEMIMIDKNNARVAFLGIFPGGQVMENYSGRCAKR